MEGRVKLRDEIGLSGEPEPVWNIPQAGNRDALFFHISMRNGLGGKDYTRAEQKPEQEEQHCLQTPAYHMKIDGRELRFL
jgi:hypothetical protein